MRKTIIFDGDDTLWPIQYKYDLVKIGFIELVNVDTSWIKWMDDLDSERVAIKKFSRSRFLETLLMAYAYICGQRRISVDINIEKEIRQLENSIFEQIELFPDAMKTLKELSQNFDLVLFTSGDEDLQREKLRMLGTEFVNLFIKVQFVEMKNEEEYEKLFYLLGVPFDKIYVVGNSMKTDINPTEKFGVKAFFIPQGSWKYITDSPQGNVKGNVRTIHSLTELKHILENDK